MRLEKPTSLIYLLLVPLRNCMVLRVLGLFKEFFPQNPTVEFGLDAQCPFHALFRSTLRHQGSSPGMK